MAAGTNAASGPEGIDNVILPNSKLQLGVGLVTYYQAVSGYKHRDRGVLPDYPVSYSITDLMARKDKEMDLAVLLARGTKAREGGAKK